MKPRTFLPYAILLGLIVGALIAKLPLPRFLAFGLAPFWYLLLIPLHELAHALSARACGLRVFEIHIGMGKRLLQTRIGSTWILLHALPLAGFTRLVPESLHRLRTRLWLTVAAGPATHVVLVLLLLLLLGGEEFWRRLVQTASPEQFDFLPSFVVANALLLLFNALPYMANVGGIPHPTDGLQLLAIPRLKVSALQELIEFGKQLPLHSLMREEKLEEALALLQSELELTPGHWRVRLEIAGIQLMLGRYEQARAAFLELRGQGSLAHQEIYDALLDNNLAYAEAMLDSGEPERMALAEELSLNALQTAPKNPYYLGTRGSVLLILGRPEQAVILLEESFQRHTEPRSRAILAAWLCRAYCALEEPAVARAWLNRASESKERQLAEDAMARIDG